MYVVVSDEMTSPSTLVHNDLHTRRVSINFIATDLMPKRSAAVLAAPLKRARYECTNKAHDSWADWPAPRSAMYAARAFLDDVIQHKRSVLIVPDKDADGLSGRWSSGIERFLDPSGHTPLPHPHEARFTTR